MAGYYSWFFIHVENLFPTRSVANVVDHMNDDVEKVDSFYCMWVHVTRPFPPRLFFKKTAIDTM